MQLLPLNLTPIRLIINALCDLIYRCYHTYALQPALFLAFNAKHYQLENYDPSVRNSLTSEQKTSLDLAREFNRQKIIDYLTQTKV